MADLETLTLQINAESQKAYDAIGKLAQRLDNLSVSIAKLETGKLNQLSFGLSNLNAVIQSMNDNSSKWDYKRIVTNISQLALINTAGLDNVSVSLSQLSSSIAGLANAADITDNVKSIILALGKLGNKNITNAIVNIPKLEKALRHLFNTIGSVKNIDQSIIDFTNSLTNLASQGSKIGSATRSINSSLNSFSTSAHRATRRSLNLASAIGKMYAEFWIAMRAASGLKKAFMSAADYLEAYNYFDVVAEKIGTDTFHKAGIGSADEYADAFVSEMKRKMHQMSGLELDLEDRLIKTTNAKNLGLNLTEITQYQASIASITNAMGQAQEVSTATAKAFSMLAADMGSLRNMDYEVVAQKLQSSLTGQARALYAFGIDLTQASLQQYAYAAGVEKAVSEMTQAEKAQLRLLAILDQSKVAWGDLAHTINSPANQLRMLKNNFAELGTVMGQLFIPVMQRVLPWVNGLSIAFKNLLVDIAGLLGIQLTIDEFGTGFSDVMEEDTEAVDDLNKSMKETKKGIREFDELKVIGGDKSKGVSGLADQIDLTEQIVKATEEYERVWDEAYDKMKSKAQEIAQNISKALEPIRTIVEDFHIGDFFKAGNDVSDLVISIFDFVSDAIDKVDWEAIGKKIGKFIEGIKWDEILKSVGNLVGSALQAAFNLWKGSFSVAPFETALLTAFGLLKFTGLGATLKDRITTSVTKYFKSTKIDFAKAGLGAIEVGLAVSMLIDNIKDVKTGEYAALSLQSLAKSTISSLLGAAGFTSVASALGFGHLGLVFTATFGIAMLINIISAKLNEPKVDIEREIEYERYQWVRDKHLDTMELFVNIDMRMGEVNDKEMNLNHIAEQVITLSASYDTLTDASKELLKIYSDELVSIMPELADSIDEVTGAYKGEREELEKLIEKEKAHIQSQAYLQNLVDLSSQKDEIQLDYDKLEQKVRDSRAAYEEAERILREDGLSDEFIKQLAKGTGTFKAGRDTSKEVEQAAKNIHRYAVAWEEAQRNFSDVQRDLIDLEDQYEYYMNKYNEVTQNTVDDVEDVIDNANRRNARLINSNKLPNAVSDVISKIDKKITEGDAVTKTDMNNLFTNINNSFAGLGDGKVPEEVQATMDNIEYAILTNSPKLINYMATLRRQMEEAFTNAVYDNAGELIYNANDISTRLSKDVGKIEEALTHNAKPVMGKLEDDIKELFGGTLPEEVDKSYKNLADTINNGGGAKAVQGALNDFKLTLVKFADDAGMNIDLALGYAITENGHMVTTAIGGVSDKTETTYKKKNEMASPSKLYKRLGKYIPDGIALGIEDGTNEVDKSMDRLATSMQAEFKGYKWNIPSLNVGRPNVGSFNYGNMDSNNAFMSQVASAFNQAAANGQTEVVFRIEGDPHGMFTVMREEDTRYKNKVGHSAFA